MVYIYLLPIFSRCDLVVVANGRKEKIASGLLNPFIAHLKVAQEQITKGGYSITLEPDPEIDASWFTRGTVERFVRFVSTPEVLERVTTIESEILQIEDAISVQVNESLGLRSATVEDRNGKLVDCMEGNKTGFDPDADMALVPYKASTQPTLPVQNNGGTQEENSKAQLLRVLETRRTVLRKEQAMAFARAVAAGFDTDNLVYLITFAERFGASRLMKACTQFIGLWKQKHETGQWIEVEPEAMSARSEFPPFNPSGIMFMGDSMKQTMETMSVSNGDASEDASKADQRTTQHSGAPHEFFHGPYQSAYPPWAMHPPYSMQGMPYYPGMNPYYPPPYPPIDDTRYRHSERRVSKKYSSDSKDSETSDDESDQSGSERDISYGHRSHNKNKRTGKKPSVVVIRNINVTSKRHGSSEIESQIGSDVASEDSDDLNTKSRKKKNKSSSSKKKDARKIILESVDDYNKDEMSYGQDGDQGNWNVFQSFLLRADERTRDNDAELFTTENKPPPARKESTSIDDSILLTEQDSAGANERNTAGFNIENGRTRPHQMLSGDELMMSRQGSGVASDGIKEIEGGDARYRRGASDDFMIYGQEKSTDRGSCLDPLAEAQYKNPTLVEKNAHSMADESFMIPLRFTSDDNLGPESHTAIDIDVELPSTVQKISDAKAGGQLFYEPDELMPERVCENISFGYDPAMDYNEMQSQPASMVEDSPVEEAALTNADEVKKPEKDKRIRSSQESSDKRRKDASVRRLSSSKGPMTDAQKRAQNLRLYKADLQKAKKEQEEEQMKRLERLKLERQKRIAARSSTSSASTTLQQPKVKPSFKVSPSTYKSSKFSDAEPASSSPLRKVPAKTTPGTDPHPQKTAKASKLIGNTNAVSKSTPSLTDMKEKSGKAESSSERLKKLAEPKTSSFTDHPSNLKSASVDHPRRRSMPQDTQRKKISAIMQLDQSKSATLPELKVKSPQAPAVVNNAIATKEKKVVSHGGKAPTTETAGVKKINGNISRMNSSDDSVVVEKTVVMLENEVVSTPPVTLHSGRNSAKETSSDDRTEKPSPELDYTAIRGPPSPHILPDAESPVTNGPDDQGNSYEVVTECRKDEPERPSLAAVEKPYQAPFARVTSLENASDYSPLPVQESKLLVPSHSIKARVPEPVHSSVDCNEVNEKPRSKEPKGFRKLLKFGRKSHTSALAEGAMDSDASSIDESPAGDGSMLKNLISQEDSGASSKASRSFSLLSPFRSKHKVIVL
ncbi:hypothetical protein PVAP13_9KG025000 [Panicum virgatum]|uniref:COP1-interacting protein 7 n=1 Tax=Panicum virgatum TaxID=38727 RepID=A0A8T0N7N5_PANVG|nr:hypothetical protein PVAP13_9KG025000 [Panicum virgatum]KAG2544317.1 hypothetical protein PVAP13_9KG025000 [Panicum virgatum]KAG2544320.1 hypothetical protein PVAP13_9KG025000 [Panicum virgatum]KAG2544322.1 hypothetical protein PVAP13_9KG025000 [Panicum virgatum]